MINVSAEKFFRRRIATQRGNLYSAVYSSSVHFAFLCPSRVFLRGEAWCNVAYSIGRNSMSARTVLPPGRQPQTTPSEARFDDSWQQHRILWTVSGRPSGDRVAMARVQLERNPAACGAAQRIRPAFITSPIPPQARRKGPQLGALPKLDRGLARVFCRNQRRALGFAAIQGAAASGDRPWLDDRASSFDIHDAYHDSRHRKCEPHSATTSAACARVPFLMANATRDGSRLDTSRDVNPREDAEQSASSGRTAGDLRGSRRMDAVFPRAER